MMRQIFNYYPERISYKEVSEEFKDSFLAIIQSGGDVEDVLSEFKREYTIQEMDWLMWYLLDFHMKAKNLLYEFWQRTSDACPLEADHMESEVTYFERFVYEHLHQ